MSSKQNGRVLVVKKYAIDMTGLWVVRVIGKAGSTGEYTVSFKVKKGKPYKFKGQALGGGFESHGADDHVAKGSDSSPAC